MRVAHDAERLRQVCLPGGVTAREVRERLGMTRRGAQMLLERAVARGWGRKEQGWPRRYHIEAPQPAAPAMSVSEAVWEVLADGYVRPTLEVVAEVSALLGRPVTRGSVGGALHILAEAGGIERFGREGRQMTWGRPGIRTRRGSPLCMADCGLIAVPGSRYCARCRDRGVS